MWIHTTVTAKCARTSQKVAGESLSQSASGGNQSGDEDADQDEISDKDDRSEPERAGDRRGLDKFVDAEAHDRNGRPVNKDLCDLRCSDDRNDATVTFAAKITCDQPDRRKRKSRAPNLKCDQRQVVSRRVADVPRRGPAVGRRRGLVRVHGQECICVGRTVSTNVISIVRHAKCNPQTPAQIRAAAEALREAG